MAWVSTQTTPHFHMCGCGPSFPPPVVLPPACFVKFSVVFPFSSAIVLPTGSPPAFRNLGDELSALPCPQFHELSVLLVPFPLSSTIVLPSGSPPAFRNLGDALSNVWTLPV